MESNFQFLENELIDILKLFHLENEKVFHFEENCGEVFKNTFEIFGQKYSFVDNYKIEKESERERELEEKRQLKKFAKKRLFEILTKKTGKEISWGALTGIRPVRLYRSLKNPDKTFKEDYFVSDEKLNLVKKIARIQQPFLAEKIGYDLYISVPFCPSKCAYCSFITCDINKTQNFIPDYIVALCREIESVKEFFPKLKSVYIGGGTPIILSEENLEKLLSAIGSLKVEYTLEAGRPDCFTYEKLDILKKHGVNRICLNPQTFCDKTLFYIGRKHTAKDIIDANKMLEKYSFSVNMDLIAGFDGETFEDFKNSLKKCVELSPDDITVHTLCLKRGSALKEKEDFNSLDGKTQKMVEFAFEYLTENGYNPYYLYRQKYMNDNLENVGYAKAGKECVYNVNTMEEISNNIALGANAVSKRIFTGENRIERYGTPKDIVTYLNKIDEIIVNRKKFFN